MFSRDKTPNRLSSCKHTSSKTLSIRPTLNGFRMLCSYAHTPIIIHVYNMYHTYATYTYVTMIIKGEVMNLKNKGDIGGTRAYVEMM